MSNFNYTARDKSGAVKTGSLKAADRNAALQALKALGLIPVSIVEGAAPKAAFRLDIAPRTLILVGVTIILAVGVLFMMQGRKQKPDVKKVEKSTRAKPVENGELAFAPPATNQEPAAPVQVAPQEVAHAEPLPAKIAVTNLPAAQRPKVRLVEAIAGMSTNPPPQDYSSGTERVINMIINTQMGSPPPPLLNLPPGENVAEILNRDIALYDDDSEKTATEKANVAYAKQLMKQYIKDGGTPETFLQYYHGELTKAFEEWRGAQQYTAGLMKIGDKEGAVKYMEEQNKKFAEKGIRPIKIPSLKK